MQKRIFFISLFVLLVVVELKAQVVKLNWTAPVVMLDSTFKSVEVLYFAGAKTSRTLLPFYEIQLYNKAVENFSLFNTVYEPLSAKENDLLDNKSFSLAISVSVVVQNRQPLSTVSFIPIRLNTSTGGYEKLVAFEYRFDIANFIVPLSSAKNSSRSSAARGARTAGYAGASVLSSGVWYKIAVPVTGIYKLDYTFLKSIGINPDNINPRTLRIVGNGFGLLPQQNDDFRPDDLVENAIEVVGQADGKFDVTDYILFYGKGPDKWVYNSAETIFNHKKNIYADKSFYFINVGSVNGLRVQDTASTGAAAQSVAHFDAYEFHEVESENLLASGREWYGEVFDASTSASFQFNTTGIVPSSSLKVTSSVLSSSKVLTSFNVSIGNSSGFSVFLGTQNLATSNLFQYDKVGVANRAVLPLPSSASIGDPSTVSVTLTYNKGSSASSIGHLDYLELNFKKTLSLFGTQTSFRTIASRNATSTSYSISNASDASIWKVSDIAVVKKMQYSVSGSAAVFSANSFALEEYVVFKGSDFPSPEFIEVVSNQNLHGTNSPSLPDLVIVTYPGFLSAANQLAAFRRTNDLLDVLVVTTDQVYNEFSSGGQDVSAVRDFMKMLFDRKTGSDSVRYLLLFGDCSYDYKNRISGNTNFVPVYQSYESLLPLSSYSSDDYFGLLDDADGDWLEYTSDVEYLDLGVGRVTVKSTEEADVFVSKLVHYSGSQSCLGKWRNAITFMSDDGDNNLHIGDANSLATLIDTTYKIFNVNKIFLDAFHQVGTAGGEKAPEVNEKLNQTVNLGTLILNYSGHGGETGLAQENILDIPQMEAWDNYNTMPLMITATCDFGRYDDPARLSGAEVALGRAGGGAIGLVSSTRVVYQYSNKALNTAIYNYIFKRLVDGKMPRMGDVIRQSKNKSVSGVNNRNYAYLGDPSMQLAYPAQNIVITKINIDSNLITPDTLKALSKATIQGEVRSSANSLLTTFNGKLTISVYDKKILFSTFGTEGSPVFPFGIRSNILFDGNASVINGKWSVTFVVPKDISYQYDFGKISVYAENTGSLNDAGGHFSNLIIGGTDPNAPEDNIPPGIKMYMDDESFVFGGLTETNSLFIAKLSDENGINTSSSGIGHEIAATLDDSETPTILSQFYTANLNDYKNGSLKYPYKGLSFGVHNLKLKVWDTYNNSAESYLEFVVAENEKMALSHILNYPNPFSTHTVFHFDHNKAGEDLDVMIQVYTVSGKLVKTLDSKVYSSTAHFAGLDWDGRDDFGDKIGKGVYVYRVWVRSSRDGSSIHKYEKLVILN